MNELQTEDSIEKAVDEILYKIRIKCVQLNIKIPTEVGQVITKVLKENSIILTVESSAYCRYFETNPDQDIQKLIIESREVMAKHLLENIETIAGAKTEFSHDGREITVKRTIMTLRQ